MSIAPPSDIILDVAQAADPQRLQAATARLGSLAAGVDVGPEPARSRTADFPALLAAAARPAAARAAAGSTPLPARTDTLPPMSPYRKFEAVLLQSFVQEMLPKDDDLFGDAASADAYRSMMAEQLAAQLARSGRIGIAEMIEKAHGPGQAASHRPGAAFGAVAAGPTMEPAAGPASAGPSPATAPVQPGRAVSSGTG